MLKRGIVIWIWVFLVSSLVYSQEKGSYYSEVEILSQPWKTFQKVYADFEYLFSLEDIKGVIDENSIMVYQIEGGREIEVLSKFVKSEGKAGYIIFEVKGEKDPQKAIKKFRIYFDEKGKETTERKRKVLEIEEANLVPNIGFEEEEREGIPARTPYFYSGSMKEVYEEGRILLDKTVYYKGRKSIKLIAAEKSNVFSCIVVTPYPGWKVDGFSYSLRVQPGKKYRFGYWSKGEKCAKPKYKEGTNVIVVLPHIYWHDKEDKYISRNTIKEIKCEEGEIPYSWEWVYNESVFIAPPNSYYGIFQIHLPCYEGVVWIDEPVIDLIDCPILKEIYKK